MFANVKQVQECKPRDPSSFIRCTGLVSCEKGLEMKSLQTFLGHFVMRVFLFFQIQINLKLTYDLYVAPTHS